MGRPAVGLLGIAHALHGPEEMKIRRDFAAKLAQRLSSGADIAVAGLASRPEEIQAILETARQPADGLVLLMLTAEPADGFCQALAEQRLPMLIANVQPERAVFEDWSDDDLAFNQGVRGAQTIANGMVRSGTPFSVVTGDWMSDAFAAAFLDWGCAAQAARSLGWSFTTEATPEGDHGEPMLAQIAELLLGEGYGQCIMEAMDSNRDSVLISPSPGFSPEPGPATTAAVGRNADGRLRLVIGSGEIGEAPSFTQLTSTHLQFAPECGIDAFLDAWLELGAPPEFVIMPGDRRLRWRRLAELLRNTTEYEEI